MSDQTIVTKQVITTAEYAKMLGVTPRTVTQMWIRGDPSVVRPINPKSYKCHKFALRQVLKKLES